MSRNRCAFILTTLGLGAFSLFNFTSIALMSSVNSFLFLATLVYFSKESFKLNKNTFPLALFLFALFLSILANWHLFLEPYKQLLKLNYYFVPLLMLPVLKNWWQNSSNTLKKTLVVIFIVFTCIASLSGIWGLVYGFNPIKWKHACHESRACGLYSHYMTYGYGISLVLVLLIGARLSYDQLVDYLPHKRLLEAAIIINISGLYLSYTRGAWLGLLLAIPLLFLKSYPKKFLKIALILLLTSLALLFSSSSLKEKILDREQSNSERLSFFTAAIYAAKEKPIFGWGYKNFEPNVLYLKEKYHLTHPESKGHGHSNYFEHLGSTGIFGLFTFIFFLVTWIVQSYKKNPILFAFTMSFAISGLFQYSFGDSENTLLIMAVYAFSQVIEFKKT